MNLFFPHSGNCMFKVMKILKIIDRDVGTGLCQLEIPAVKKQSRRAEPENKY